MSILYITLAGSFAQRLRGLLGRPPLAADQGLLLCPCRAVHTFFMRYPIDVVFLDGTGRILKICESMRPWRLSSAVGARSVLELGSGQAARHGLTLGSEYRF
jgi:uncharacterized membrane protein (UPF0127 family)